LPWTVTNPVEAPEPALVLPTTVAFKFAAVACVTVDVHVPLWVAATVPVTVAFKFAAVVWVTVTVPETGCVTADPSILNAPDVVSDNGL
jgi:hypothetical protein